MNDTSSSLGNVASTPMMQQYLNIKRNYPDMLLFFRMGDFYELFLEDAIEAAALLNIALTKRGKHAGEDIAMCGVPYHSYHYYVQKLIKEGKKIAICEQLETPEQAKKRGYKAIVERDVVRIITPGTVLEENLLEPKANHFLAAIAHTRDGIAIAWCDLSIGQITTTSSTEAALGGELSRLNPKEIVISEALLRQPFTETLFKEINTTITTQVSSAFDRKKTEEILKKYYGIATLDGLAHFTPAEISACGALIDYIQLTQKRQGPPLQFPTSTQPKHFLTIDAASRRSLEMVETSSGHFEGSLLAAIDRTLTAAGARLLEQHISAPLAQAAVINERLDGVEYFLADHALLSTVRHHLQQIPDLHRILTRLTMRRGGPRDLLALREGIKVACFLHTQLQEYACGKPEPKLLKSTCPDHAPLHALIALLNQGLRDDVPLTIADGNFVRPGFRPHLDQLIHHHEHADSLKLAMRDRYRQITGVSSLKIEENNVLGMFIDVTSQHASKLMQEPFIHRQSLASSVRFTTAELQSLEAAILQSRLKKSALENEIFEEFILAVTAHSATIQQLSYHLALIDVLTSHAFLAYQEHYVRPTITDGMEFSITQGRHPVIEQQLRQMQTSFSPNHCTLEAGERLWLITGPNMAGKSTFLRQNALIVIMAQSGCYVPAAAATIGVVDAVFSRVGAADDLARGRSTFMVEMIETAAILNQATSKSLLILDEVGRGTATYDGVSIAWAVLEHIHYHLQCRGLFATHYHELTHLEQGLNHLKCYQMRVQEWNNEVVFYHEIIPGAALQSFGLHVAKLAGIPKSVLRRAEGILQQLNQKNHLPVTADLPLFQNAITVSEPPLAAPLPSPILRRLSDLQLDELSPKEALNILYDLASELQEA